MARSRFQVLYSDIGGVLGTNGWDGALRHKTAEHFGLNTEEIDSRHSLVFDSYERGNLPLVEYLKRVFFDVERPFSLEDLRDYIYSQSVPWEENIEFFRQVKGMNGIKLALISNEGQGIADHRVEKFGLREVADFIVISHCVHFRKPDPQIWRLSLDLAQVSAEKSIYVDDRKLFAMTAADLGFAAFQHLSLEETKARISELGLKTPNL